MDNSEIKQKLLELKMIVSEFKKSGRILECFCSDQNMCKGNIKQSHSIQRNGRLSIIEGNVNGNSCLYTFTDYESDGVNAVKTLKPIGKAIASTFFGFCDYHDTSIFSPIENFQFNESPKHCFLHSYRSFAHSYHRKKEELKAYKSKSKYTDLMPKEVLSRLTEGAEVGVAELEVRKKYLDNLLITERFDELEYLTFIIPEKFPIACSSQISPLYSYSGRPMNNHMNPNEMYSHIMLTVLPDTHSTVIIFACFPEDVKGIDFLDELDALYPLQFKQAVSSILINNAENTFFAPALWDKLGPKGQRILCKELEISFSQSPAMFDRFPHTETNFFHPKLSAHSLGLS